MSNVKQMFLYFLTRTNVFDKLYLQKKWSECYGKFFKEIWSYNCFLPCYYMWHNIT